jgi:hypothetical protein
LRPRKAAFVALVLIIAFILCLPLLELIDYNDLVLTGQDLEISILDMLTIFCVWFILVVRLLAFLPQSWRGAGRIAVKASTDHRPLFSSKCLSVLFLPDELNAPSGAFPLLI